MKNTGSRRTEISIFNGILQTWLIRQNERFSLFKTGRLSRLELLRNYEIAVLFPWVLFLLLLLSSLAVGGDVNWQHIIGPVGTVVLAIVGIAIDIGAGLVGIFAAIQRFHDLGKSGWRTLLLLIPFANIVFALILLFKKGDPAENQYGPVPKGVKRPWIPIGVIGLLFLIWIGIVVSLLISNFKGFPFSYMSGQLNNQIMTMDATQISLYKSRTGSFPPNLDVLLPTSTATFFSPVDPWGGKLVYATSSDGHFTLRSGGPDGALNTGDDVIRTY